MTKLVFFSSKSTIIIIVLMEEENKQLKTLLPMYFETERAFQTHSFLKDRIHNPSIDSKTVVVNTGAKRWLHSFLEWIKCPTWQGFGMHNPGINTVRCWQKRTFLFLLFIISFVRNEECTLNPRGKLVHLKAKEFEKGTFFKLHFGRSERLKDP